TVPTTISAARGSSAAPPATHVSSPGPYVSDASLQDTEDEDEDDDADLDDEDNVDSDDGDDLDEDEEDEEEDATTASNSNKNSDNTSKPILDVDPRYTTPHEAELLADMRAASTWSKPGMKMFMNWLTNPIYWQMYNKKNPEAGYKQGDLRALLAQMINDAIKAEQAKTERVVSSLKKDSKWTAIKVKTSILYVRRLFRKAVKLNSTGKGGTILNRQEKLCPYFVRLQPIFGVSLAANPPPARQTTRRVKPTLPPIELEEESSDPEVQGASEATNDPAASTLATSDVTERANKRRRMLPQASSIEQRLVKMQEFADRQREDAKEYNNSWKQRADEIVRQERELFDKLTREAQGARTRLAEELAAARAEFNKTLAFERAEHNKNLGAERSAVTEERDRDRARWGEERMLLMEKISDLKTELAVARKEIDMVYRLQTSKAFCKYSPFI
ncbi:hypothetical protein BGW38_007365, partial [Lunasporangiospora selenospora]